MRLRFIFPSILALILMTTLALPTWAEETSRAAEIAKIETIIKSLESLKNATFVRDGSTYDSKTAVKFLLNKLERHSSEVKTAAEFIDIHASKSYSGNPYLIRFDDGHELKCLDYLKAQLKKIESPPTKSF